MTESTRNPQDLHHRDAQERQRQVLIRLVRMFFLVVFGTVVILSFLGVGLGGGSEVAGVTGRLTLIIGIGLAVMVGIIDYFTPRKKLSTISTIFFGLLAAALATIAVGYLIDLLVYLYDINNPPLVATTKALVGIALAYLTITTVLQTQDDFRLVVPYIEFAKTFRGVRPMLADTSALIDGRVADVAQTGFMQAPLVVPRFVIQELQTLADSDDAMKRAKGRRGLDVITRLQRSPRLDLTIDETPVPGKSVDQMLVEFARTMPAIIITTDVALSRIAAIHSVSVLNLNELGNALKSLLIPGEQITIRLIKHGEQHQQGVGYLPDGTMVVAEDGAAFIGQDAQMTVISSLQTSAGRMVFARVHPEAPTETGTAAESTPADSTAAQSAPSAMTETPTDAAGPQATGAAPTTPPRPRGPFPPKPPASFRGGTQRNPRR